MLRAFSTLHSGTRLAIVLAVLICTLTGCSRKATDEMRTEEVLRSPVTPAPVPQVAIPVEDQKPVPAAKFAPLSEKGTPSRPALTENPNYIPTQPTMGPVFDAVGARIESELKRLEPRSPEAARKVAELWNAAAEKTLNEPTGDGDTAVNAGTKLPAEIRALRGLSDQELELLLVGGSLPFALTREEFETAVSRLLLSASATVSGLAALPPLLEQRAETLPPTREDIVNFFAVSQGLRELRSLSVGASTLNEWIPLSGAKNPVYRLLALMAAQNATTVETQFTSSESSNYAAAVLPQRLAFYRKYLDEKDPLILATALQAIGNVSLPEAKVTLEDFRNRQLSARNAELVALSDAAIKSCESNLRWSSAR